MLLDLCRLAAGEITALGKAELKPCFSRLGGSGVIIFPSEISMSISVYHKTSI
jgi:hypothetical protein